MHDTWSRLSAALILTQNAKGHLLREPPTQLLFRPQRSASSYTSRRVSNQEFTLEAVLSRHGDEIIDLTRISLFR